MHKHLATVDIQCSLCSVSLILNATSIIRALSILKVTGIYWQHCQERHFVDYEVFLLLFLCGNYHSLKTKFTSPDPLEQVSGCQIWGTHSGVATLLFTMWHLPSVASRGTKTSKVREVTTLVLEDSRALGCRICCWVNYSRHFGGSE